MRQLLLFFILSLFTSPLLRAQSVEEIQNSKEYIWGTGNLRSKKPITKRWRH